MNQELFDYLERELGVTALYDQLGDIIKIANKVLKEDSKVFVKMATHWKDRHDSVARNKINIAKERDKYLHKLRENGLEPKAILTNHRG